MFFLLRMAFWLGLVLVLLPTDKTPDSASQPEVNASEAVSAATAAVSDMSQFCARQPAACTVGGQAASVIGHRAQAGARKVYQYITDKTDKAEKSEKSDKAEKSEKADKADKKPVDALAKDKDKNGARKAPDHTGSIGTVAETDETTVAIVRDTLTAADQQMEWQPPTP